MSGRPRGQGGETVQEGMNTQLGANSHERRENPSDRCMPC
jgi:hypothetical protein